MEDPISVSITPCACTSNSELSLSSLAESANLDSSPRMNTHPADKDTDLFSGTTLTTTAASTTVAPHPSLGGPSPPVSPLNNKLDLASPLLSTLSSSSSPAAAFPASVSTSLAKQDRMSRTSRMVVHAPVYRRSSEGHGPTEAVSSLDAVALLMRQLDLDRPLLNTTINVDQPDHVHDYHNHHHVHQQPVDNNSNNNHSRSLAHASEHKSEQEHAPPVHPQLYPHPSLPPPPPSHLQASPSPSEADSIDHERDFRAEREVNTPTLEQMGLDKLDELELRMLLQNAYEVIQEKERDLGMAARMGQGLVESNTTLQAKYQHILTQLRQQRLHRPRQLTPPRTIILSPPPELPSADGGGADEDGDENWVDDFEPISPLQHHSHHRSSGGPMASSLSYPSSPSAAGPFPNVSFRRSTSHSGLMMRSRSRQDIEKLATLEDLNSELQAKVDGITKELKQGRRQAFKRHRKAELELKAAKDELERTTVKVVDLEEQNGRLIEASKMFRQRRIMLQKQLPAPGSIPGSTMATIAVEMQGDDMTIQEMLAEDNRIFEELRDRLQSLEKKNAALGLIKSEVDKKMQQTVLELEETRKENEELLTNLCGFSDLQTAYDEQTAHVKELENNLHELQNQISTMSSRLSQMNSPLLSPAEPSSPMQSLWRRDDADFKALKTILHGSTPQPMVLKSPGLKGQRRPRRTLLAELESEWFRDVSFFGPPRVVEQQQQPMSPHGQKSKKALKHRHDSESESFSDDTGGRVKGWRERIQNMDEDEVCESSSCIRKRNRRHGAQRIQFGDMTSDTDGQGGHGGEDSDVERYRLRQRKYCHGSEDEGDFELSDHEHAHPLSSLDDGGPAGSHSSFSGHSQRRSSTPGCCCHLYDYSSGYTSYTDDDDMEDRHHHHHHRHRDDDEESVVGWAHFEDYDTSRLGYDKYRDGSYMGRRSRRGIFGMVQSVFLMLRLIWRWCRFISILSTALAIAVYRGPDALLTDGH